MFGFPGDLADKLAHERPVVVMGRGHSGTRVLAWALDALGLRMGTLPEKATGDAQDRRFTRCMKRIAMRQIAQPALADPDPRDVARFRRRAWRFLEWIGDAPLGWGWKFPETYLIGRLVDEVFPKARYLHMVRDGRDLAFKSHLTDDEGRGLGRVLLDHLGVRGQPRHVQAARSWDFQVLRFTEVEGCFPDRVHRLTFEALCRDPLVEMEAVCRFLGLPMTQACRTYLSDNVRPGKISQYREEDPEKVAEVERILGPTLEQWGYELESRKGAS